MEKVKYECDGQITINQYIEAKKPIEYGHRGCNSCSWYNFKEMRCSWAISRSNHKKRVDYEYPECGDISGYMPNEYKVPRMCANCKWANSFEYETKPEYAEDLKRHNGYTRQAADDPLEEPNIYCTHPDGSLNRRTEYKDIESPGFGVGHWHRQHEWDTCDRWELERGCYRNFSELEGK